MQSLDSESLYSWWNLINLKMSSVTILKFDYIIINHLKYFKIMFLSIFLIFKTNVKTSLY